MGDGAACTVDPIAFSWIVGIRVLVGEVVETKEVKAERECDDDGQEQGDGGILDGTVGHTNAVQREGRDPSQRAAGPCQTHDDVRNGEAARFGASAGIECHGGRTALHDSLRGQSGGFDVVELGKTALQVGVSLKLQASLLWTVADRGPFSVAFVQFIDDIHACDDFAEGRKSLGVQAAVVAEVDEHLDGSGVGS